MELSKWEPSGLSMLRRQMDRLFDTFLGREPTPFGNGGWLPVLDEVETAEEIVVKAELPGMDENDISVTLSGDKLMIKGERKAETEEKDKHFHRVERSYGKFERVLSLPTAIDQEKITADYKKGVLEVHLPKKAPTKPKEITVQVK